jgi:signal transduction histidine kinase
MKDAGTRVSPGGPVPRTPLLIPNGPGVTPSAHGLRPGDEARPLFCGYRRCVASERDLSYPRREPQPLPTYRPAGSARAPKPPLTKRMRRGHWIAIDCVVAAVTALAVVLLVGRSGGPPPDDKIAPPVAIVVGAWVFVPIGFRRRAPVTAFGALVILAVLIAGSNPVGAAVIFLGAAYVLYLVTTTSNRQTGAAALGLALSVMLLIALFDHSIAFHGGAGPFVPVAFAMVIAWMSGYSVRQRRLYAQTIQEQATSSAVAEERLRIARELHDVVAHSMSVIAVQAGYGQYVIDNSPGDAREALGAIQATSRDALEEMRRMLGVLRQPDTAPEPPGAPGTPGAPGGAAPDAPSAPGTLGAPRTPGAPLAPAPGLANLGRLVDRTHGAGVEVSVECSGEVRAVPAGVDLSAYRIIQEALTNVVKHAGNGAHCTVRLEYLEDALDIRVADDGGSLVLSPASPRPPGPPAVGAGHGIIGMRERALLCGGAFSAGALPDGGFEVTATLPLLGAAAAAPGGEP